LKFCHATPQEKVIEKVATSKGRIYSQGKAMPPEGSRYGELFKSIGRTLALRRQASGLTQDQVAEALEIGTEAVSRMERGLTIPTVQRLAELADVYGCGIDELLIACSNRTSDQTERISQILQTLPEEDRTMIVEVVQKIAERLKDHM
jgi:transcriptional regulator with XRE-family HTH domain